MALSRDMQVVTGFLEAWNRQDLDGIASRLAPDVFYHNIPMEPVLGRDAVVAGLAPFVQGCTAVDWQVLHIADTGSGAVLTERVDNFVMGEKRMSVRVMGTFELRDGLITHWRDYFDLAEFQKQA